MNAVSACVETVSQSCADVTYFFTATKFVCRLLLMGKRHFCFKQKLELEVRKSSMSQRTIHTVPFSLRSNTLSGRSATTYTHTIYTN